MAFTDWNTNANLNTNVGGINIAENCPAANINNAIREVMAEMRTAIVPALGGFLGGGVLPLASGGTGATTDAAARTALGLGDAATHPASDFATAAALGALIAQFAYTSNANGNALTLPGGVIIQWGVNPTVASEVAITQTWPIPFTNASTIAVVVAELNPSASSGNDMWAQVVSRSTASFTAMYASQTGGNLGYGFHWIAIGK